MEETTTVSRDDINAIIEKYDYLKKVTDAAQRRSITGKLKKEAEPLKEALKAAGDKKLLAALLRWEQAVRAISVKDQYVLNEIDYENLEDEYECIKEPPSRGFHAHVGTVGKYYKVFDHERNKEMYHFFVPREVEPEFQLSKNAAKKMQQGYVLEPKDFPESKTLYNRYSLVDTEWTKYFQEI